MRLHTKNRLPHKSLQGKAPLELFRSCKITEERKFLRAFGEAVWAHVIDVPDKFDPRVDNWIYRHMVYTGYTVNLAKQLLQSQKPAPKNQIIVTLKSQLVNQISSSKEREILLQKAIHKKNQILISQKKIIQSRSQ
jgi:hypothetical protein